jgi:hypothetical protein
MERRGYEINLEEGIWRIVTYPQNYTYLEHRCTSTDRGPGDKMPWRGDWKVLTFWEDCCHHPCIHCDELAPEGMQATFWMLKSAPDQAEASRGWQ